jgi:hypothetical protein
VDFLYFPRQKKVSYKGKGRRRRKEVKRRRKEVKRRRKEAMRRRKRRRSWTAISAVRSSPPTPVTTATTSPR